MNIKLILGGVLLLAALVFSVQNAGVVDVKFLGWKFSTSLATGVIGKTKSTCCLWGETVATAWEMAKRVRPATSG